MSALSLAAICRYPLKSALGESLAQATSDAFGLQGDRRWMLVDEAGVFVSQRSEPALARIAATLDGAALTLAAGGDQMVVETPGDDAPTRPVEVWKDRLTAREAAPAASAWLSARLARAVKLVHMPASAQRFVDRDYAHAGQRVAFSDGFPLLLVTAASLDELNRRLPTPVAMDRFRPNLVIGGATPHAEDGWRELRVGDALLKLVKPCSRCAVPSVVQGTGARDPHINRALAAYRRREGVIYFGMNALVTAGATFTLGDPVEVLQ